MVSMCLSVSVQQGAGNQIKLTSVEAVICMCCSERTDKTAHTNWVLQQPQSHNALSLPRGHNVCLCLCSYRGFTASVCVSVCVCMHVPISYVIYLSHAH